jgi:hypothetical protein
MNPPRIVLEADGFAVVAPDGQRHVLRWASVTRVGAYKRDHLTTDEICLVFEVTESPDSVLEVSEEWPGFKDLFGALERELGISPDWYREIILPAFEPTPRVLLDRRTPSTDRQAPQVTGG